MLSVFSAFSSCSGGSGDGTSFTNSGSDSANANCDGSCPNQILTEAGVTKVLRQAIAGATAQGVAATIAVTDRVGNVLAVYRMPGAASSAVITSGSGAIGGLEGAVVPATLAAISKAGTGAYLSSQGNAFSTRTASQIIQEHFNPGERNAPGGPLFGVQFSQLPCSDVTKSLGPRPLPLGLSGDPGGLPLYTAGDLVGAVGVELDGAYTLDPNIQDTDDSVEERIALSATTGFETPSERVADVITVGGKSLRFADISYSQLAPLPAELPALDSSGLVSVPPFFSGTIHAGKRYGDPDSGFAYSSRAGILSMDLVSGSGAPRYPLREGTPLDGGVQLHASEVDAILSSALTTASRARAAIRRPLDTPARVSVFIIDTQGSVIGFTRSVDAPVFGGDVALQKARTALFFSSSFAATALQRAGVGDYVSRSQGFFGPDIFTGNAAFSNRAIGNLARPFLPDGIDGSGLTGPLSLPHPAVFPGANTWSPFNVGLQFDLIRAGLLAPLSGSIPSSCTDTGIFGHTTQNGIQIFPGAVPLYRGTTLIGAIGVSGDGIDQDDLVAYFGASRQGLDFVGKNDLGDPVYGFNAPAELRADNLSSTVDNLRVRYVSCPEAPFIGSDEQNVCP